MIDAIFAFLLSLATSLFLGKLFIRWMNRLHLRKEVRMDVPETHLIKRGTPSMGGVFLILSAAFASLIVQPSPGKGVLILALAGFGGLGLIDDYVKATGRPGGGIKARHKFLGQFFLAAVFLLFGLRLCQANIMPRYQIGDLPLLEGVWYLVFVLVLIVGSCNAVNLTDGLDGLAAGLTVISSAALVFVALCEGNRDVALTTAAVCGGTLGFLFYNRHPARIFMGDTGSLALGGFLALSAVCLWQPYLFLLIGLVFFIEAFSVVVQVLSFKLTGRRIFPMTPLHHSFELWGWSETKIVQCFWLVSLISAAASLIVWQITTRG